MVNSKDLIFWEKSSDLLLDNTDLLYILQVLNYFDNNVYSTETGRLRVQSLMRSIGTYFTEHDIDGVPGRFDLFESEA